MAAITLYRNSNGSDIANTYVTKEYVMDWYPDLVPAMVTPQLWAWGYDAYGQLGDGTTSSRLSPVTTIGGTTWKQVSCTSYHHAAAIKSDGTLWTWGHNTYGQLGDNTTSSRSSPVTVAGGGTNWAQVSTGSFFVAAIKTDGTLWTWGQNTYGGLGVTASRSSPGTVTGGGTNWKQVSAGLYHTAAIKTDGTLWAWGYDAYGQLGDGTTTNKSSPVTVSGGGTNWKQVSCSNGYNTAAIKTDGTLWTWGRDQYGQLGHNTVSVNTSSPVTVSGGGTNWKQVACGYAYTAVIKTDGTLWTWGYNNNGQLGTGTTSYRSSPGTTVGGGTNWKQVSPGLWHTAAIKSDGTLWTWGINDFGQLGNGTTSIRSSPVTVAGGGTNWKQVSAAFYFSLAISEAEGW